VDKRGVERLTVERRGEVEHGEGDRGKEIYIHI
jgi:hypothetical protein